MPELRNKIFIIEVAMFMCFVLLSYVYLSTNHESKPALILIDCWELPAPDVDPEGFKNMTESYPKVVAVLDFARSHDWHVLHLPHGRKICDLVKPIEGEFVWDSQSKAPIDYLRENKISELYYAGYASNVCVINRMPYGLLNMLKYGYKCTFIEDASSPSLNPPSHAIVCEGGHDGAIKEVLKHGGSVIRSLALLRQT